MYTQKLHYDSGVVQKNILRPETKCHIFYYKLAILYMCYSTAIDAALLFVYDYYV